MNTVLATLFFVAWAYIQPRAIRWALKPRANPPRIEKKLDAFEVIFPPRGR